MPHRDPESGQFVAGDGSDHGLSYSDHDVHHIDHVFTNQSGTQNPGELRNTKRFEITERGLDPDEIAELRYATIHVGTRYVNAGSDVGPPTCEYSVDIGYNLAEGEFVSDNLTENLLDPDDDATNEYEVRFGDTDEVGEIYHESGSLAGPSFDDTDAVGTGPAFRSQTVDLDMADRFGSGPFVDSADDFVSSIEILPERVNGELGISLSMSLYYNVLKTEGGRSRFGR